MFERVKGARACWGESCTALWRLAVRENTPKMRLKDNEVTVWGKFGQDTRSATKLFEDFRAEVMGE
jgi:hypothetical protein